MIETIMLFPIELVCVDIDGTLTRGIGGPSIDGVAAALAELRRFYQVDGVEVVRRVWKGTAVEPDAFRGGIGLSSTGATAALAGDDVRVADGGVEELPGFAPGRLAAPLYVVENGADLELVWGPSCGFAGDFAVYAGGGFGAPDDDAPVLCTTGRQATVAFAAPAVSTFYLVVPQGECYEGWRGGGERPPSAGACRPQALGACRSSRERAALGRRSINT